jgi:hypothetical protein
MWSIIADPLILFGKFGKRVQFYHHIHAFGFMSIVITSCIFGFLGLEKA